MCMQTGELAAAAEVPRWLLWLVACVCFGSLGAMLLLGLLVLPWWVAMLAMALSQPERFAESAGAPLWTLVSPICYVIGGAVGLIGLLRVLTLSRRERPRRHRVFTLGMIVIGVVALAIFDLTVFADGGSVLDGGSIVGLVICVVLPFGGGAWLLSKSWKFLVAG